MTLARTALTLLLVCDLAGRSDGVNSLLSGDTAMDTLVSQPAASLSMLGASSGDVKADGWGMNHVVANRSRTRTG
eukprot:598926-Rhodomonas_salina.3